MMRSVLVVLVSAMLAACNASSAPDSSQTTTTAPVVVAGKRQVTLPSLSSTSLSKLRSGTITLGTETGAGTATFVGAPRWAEDTEPTFGAGTFSIQVGAETYAASTSQSVFVVVPDDSGSEYLVLASLTQTPTRAQVLYVVVKASDLVAGADVALDGNDRFAFYAEGPIDAEDPDKAAVATVGTVHFGAGATANGPIDATLSGTFQRADITPDPNDPGDPTTGTVAPPTAGSYTIHASSSDVRCDGSLAGKEADFQAITAAQSGIEGLAVELTVVGGVVTLTGPNVASVFGTSSLELQPSDSTWEAYGAISNGAAGPDGTTRVVAAISLDPVGMIAQIALVYALDDLTAGSSYCTSAFLASLD